jgi:hypothetical protein
MKKIMNWTTAIDEVTNAFIQNFEHLNNEQLNWKPNPNTWSIAQNLEHLIVVNETYYPVLAALKEGNYKTPFIAKLGFMVSFFGKTVLNAVNPDRQKKMKTFPIWQPQTSEINNNILERFKNHQKELKQKIKEAKELIENGAIISSPANRNIVYTLETAFDIIVTHEQRHLEQSKEILLLLKK